MCGKLLLQNRNCSSRDGSFPAKVFFPILMCEKTARFAWKLPSAVFLRDQKNKNALKTAGSFPRIVFAGKLPYTSLKKPVCVRFILARPQKGSFIFPACCFHIRIGRKKPHKNCLQFSWRHQNCRAFAVFVRQFPAHKKRSRNLGNTSFNQSLTRG